MSSLDIRQLRGDDVDAMCDMVDRAFGGSDRPEDRAVEVGVLDLARMYGGFDRGDLVATAGSFRFLMTVPGARMHVAGITWVAVEATHRRRGLLRTLMSRQLADLRGAGESVAALWASQGSIYQRFGYGPASWATGVTVPSKAAFRSPVGPAVHLRRVRPEVNTLAPIYDRAAQRTAGWCDRDDAWWAYRLHDPEHSRDGFSPLGAIVADDGYVLYATKPDWTGAGPAGTVRVRELVATSPASVAALWRFVLDLDLMASITAWPCPPDNPLLHLLAEPRAAQATLRDNLWVRLVDVPLALEARRYATAVDVVLEVTDTFCPWNAGRWRLTGGPGGATCAATADPADLTLGVADLGAAYLGGSSLVARAAAGGVVEWSAGSLSTSTALGWPGPAPYCPMVF
ncbi:MAG: GNAT family N-acetyltransferase [Actinomycetota bacterium]|nr:GNAT family N-acetyltransferase [Actinomycetota bacterium]